MGLVQYLFSWRGRVGRRDYLAAGLGLFAIKFAIDSAVSRWIFAVPWSPLYYLHLYHYAPSNDPNYYFVFLALSLPFIWMGVGLTHRRLQDAGLPRWLTLMFFIPVMNLLFFAVLSAVGSRFFGDLEERTEKPPALLQRAFVAAPLSAGFLSILLTSLLAAAALQFSFRVSPGYGMGLFVVLPFCQGLGAVLFYSQKSRHSRLRNIGVAVGSVGLTGLMLMMTQFEGAICLAMASPIALGLALMGAIVGDRIQNDYWTRSSAHAILLVMALALPLLMGAERAFPPPNPVYAVTTAVDIEMAPEVVWKNVVSFSELPPPREWIFKTGIAYPTSAAIDGAGAGAVRHCQFTTGEFVEPIEVWDAPRRLAFSVAAYPRPMQEWNPFGDIHPPHLDDYMVSQRGEFRLTATPKGTHLVGTTWYQHGLWPAAYWRMWTDLILHQIHGRVLRHIKALSEKPL